MSATVTETATFDLPPDRVWRYLADFSNLAEWDPLFDRSERVSPGTELEVGTRFRVVAEVAGQEVEVDYRITEADEPHHAVLVGEGDGFTSIDRITVTATDDGGATLEWNAEVDADVAVLDTLATPIFKAVAKASINGLRDELGRD